jgi:GDP-L-fucose synthase
MLRALTEPMWTRRILAHMPGTFYQPIPLDAKIHVAGHRGLVGSAIWRHLETRGHTALIGRSSSELDLRDRESTFDFFADLKPEYVVLAAARVCGILANSTYPADFLSDNIRIQVNVLDAARTAGVKRVLFLGSSCIYPKFAPQPISEDSLLTGPLEPTNDAYAIAKIAGVLQVQALRRQYGASFISATPTNLYGPGDNFDLESSHVLPAMIRKSTTPSPMVKARPRCRARVHRAGSSSTLTTSPTPS